MIQRTVPHKNYITPSKKEIEHVVKKMNLQGTYSVQLVQDIANLTSFPEDERAKAFTKPSTWNYDNVEPKEGETQEKAEERVFEFNKKAQEFLKNIDVSVFNGDTPLEQALNIAHSLSNQGAGGRKGKGGATEEEELPIFQGNQSGANIAKKLKENAEMVGKIMPADSFTEKALLGDQDPSVFNGVRAGQLGAENLDVLKKLSILNRKGNIKAYRSKSKEDDPSARKTRMLRIQQYSEVQKVGAIQLAMPTFNYKVATKQLEIKKGVRISFNKQVLILLIDDSGSMHDSDKIGWVKALLLNRCEQVSQGNAELYICTFESRLDPHWLVIKTREECLHVWEKFNKYFQFGRGGTDMQRAIENTIEFIKKGSVPTKEGEVSFNGDRPQICIINDGQDHIKEGWYPKVVTHGFILEGDHEGMQKFCIRSGGSYQEFSVKAD